MAMAVAGEWEGGGRRGRSRAAARGAAGKKIGCREGFPHPSVD